MQNGQLTVDARYWISQASGRLLHQEFTLALSGAAMRTVIDFDYKDVKPPQP